MSTRKYQKHILSSVVLSIHTSLLYGEVVAKTSLRGLPSQPATADCHHNPPTLIAITIRHCGLPSQPAAADCRHNPPPRIAVTTRRRGLPSQPAAADCRHNPPPPPRHNPPPRIVVTNHIAIKCLLLLKQSLLRVLYFTVMTIRHSQLFTLLTLFQICTCTVQTL